MKPQTALISLALLASGCADGNPLTYEGAQKQVERDLASLRALELFEVGQMVLDSGDAPGVCYGECPDETRRRKAYVDQSIRLHALVGKAQDLDAAPRYAGPIEAELEALNALEIVQVGDFIATEAESSPLCYNLPCAEDERAAAELNAVKQAKIAELRTSAEKL